MKKYNAKKCSILPLVLTHKWYDAIDKGDKREEYRLNSDRNQTLICNWMDRAKMDGLLRVVAFQRGYSKPGMFWLVRPYWKMSSTPVSHPEWGEDQYAGKLRWVR